MLAAAGPISLAAAGLGLMAVGVLFALHHLRARPQRRAVATLVFWRQATRQQQARVAWALRFSHLRTFLLLSLIALLLAAAMTADRWGRASSGTVNVAVVDVGASMAGTAGDGASLLKSAQAALRADVDQFSAAPALIAAAAQPTLLCPADEPEAVFADRLNRLAPAESASASGLALELAANVIGARDGLIYWYTDRPALPPELPAEVAKRVRLRRQAVAGEAVAIVGVVFEPAAEDPLHGVLRVRLAGRSARPITLDATTARGPLRRQPVTRTGDTAEVRFDPIAADGGVVTLKLVDAPGAPAEHVVRYALPKRSPIRFCVSGVVPEALRLVLAAIGTETASPDGAIVVTAQGKPIPAGAAGAIVVIDDDSASALRERIAIPTGAASSIGGLDFEGATAVTAPDMPSGARPVLVAGRATVMALGIAAGRRELYVSKSLVGKSADLPRRAVFPVLMYRLATDLAGWQEAWPVVPAARAVQDPLWQQTDLNALGTSSPLSRVYDVPLLPEAARDGPDGKDVPPSAASGSWPWVSLLLTAALGCLVVEGLLLAGKKIV